MHRFDNLNHDFPGKPSFPWLPFLMAINNLKIRSSDKEVQTIICVHPHILASNKVKAHVISESKCQTEVTIKPDQEDKNLYSMLEYTPFQDIQKKSVRTLKLPRKPRLQFSSSIRLNLNDRHFLWDDDGVNELCIELKERAKQKHTKNVKSVRDVGTQTDDRK